MPVDNGRSLYYIVSTMKIRFLRAAAVLLAAVSIAGSTAAFAGCGDWIEDWLQNDSSQTPGEDNPGEDNPGEGTGGGEDNPGEDTGGGGDNPGEDTDGGGDNPGEGTDGDEEDPGEEPPEEMPSMPDAPVIADFTRGQSGDFYASHGWTNGGMFNCVWSGTSAVLADGLLSLTVSKGSDRYYGAEYRTYGRGYTFGYYGACMKAAKCSGVVSSLFTYTGPSDGTRWDEIDIEFLGKDTTKVQFNYYVDGVGGHEYLYDLGFDASEEFHEYGFLWQRDRITWYVDGEAVYTVQSDNLPVTDSRIMMNAWNSIGMDDWTGPLDESSLPATAQYKWVRYMAV